MPGPILHLGATVLCSHGGQGTPTAPNGRVMVSGQPVTTLAAPYAVVGCPFVPNAGNGPCATGQWSSGAARVFAGGQPVLVMSGTSTCVPTGTPLVPLMAQTRVIAS